MAGGSHPIPTRCLFKAKDAPALQAWYKQHLGIDVQDWGGTAFTWTDTDGKPTGGTTLQQQIDNKSDFETFFGQAPQLNPNAAKITGVICGYRVEEIEDKLVQNTRCLDKLIDEVAKGKAMDKILRK